MAARSASGSHTAMSWTLVRGNLDSPLPLTVACARVERASELRHCDHAPSTSSFHTELLMPSDGVSSEGSVSVGWETGTQPALPAAKLGLRNPGYNHRRETQVKITLLHALLSHTARTLPFCQSPKRNLPRATSMNIPVLT